MIRQMLPVDDCDDETSYSAEAMEAERQRCYALGVAAGRERMLAGYREIAAASDLQMRDGDFARDIAERML